MTNGDYGTASDERVVYVAKEGDSTWFVRAIDATSGDVHWQTALPDDGPGFKNTMAIGSGRVVTCNGAGHVFCMDYESGQALWSAAIERKFTGNSSQAVVLVLQKVVLVDYEGRLTCFALDGQQLWERAPIGVGAIGTPDHVAHPDHTT